MSNPSRLPLRLGALAATASVLAGCAFGGVNSLPLPGTVGHGSGADIYHVQIANVATLESNSPVLIGDVVVGSVGRMRLDGQHADVEVSLTGGTVVPENVVATVGQTSLLGSMHLSLDPPEGQEPAGQIEPGATIALFLSSNSPTTEKTLSSLSTMVNAGGLGQVGNIVHNLNAALSVHQESVRSLIGRLDNFVGLLDRQRSDMIASMTALNRLAETLGGQRSVIEDTLRALPPALDVLLAEKPRFVTALDKLRVFANTATGVVNDTQDDLVRDLTNLAPTVAALADVGGGLVDGLMYATVFPYGQNIVDRGLKGDYLNLFAVADLTVPRLKRTLFAGTRWGMPGAELVPAPGDPGYDWYYTNNPLGVATEIPPEGSQVAGPPPPIGPPVVLPGGAMRPGQPPQTVPLGGG